MSVDTDFACLGGINRDLNHVTEAANKIEQTKNKILYALFWFQNANRIDETSFNYLAQDDVEKAIEIWNKPIGNSRDEVNSKNISAYLC